MPNRYNDQDYPRYYDRNDRYDSQSERGYSQQQNRRGDEQRNRSGSGRENTQGGSSDYNRDRESGYYGMSHNREEGRNQGFGGTGFQSGYFGSDFGRGYDQQDRDYSDFATTTRPGSNLTGGFGRNTGSDREDYTLYGYDRDSQYATREGDQGGYGERTEDYRNQNYGYSGGGGSYARSYDRNQQDREHGGSSRYYGNQSGSSSYGQQRDDASERYRRQQREGQSFYGQGGSYSGGETDYDQSPRENRFRDRARSEQEERGFWEKTTDEVASWFGDEEAARRRERDSRENDYSRYQSGNQQNTSSFRGKGPKNYRRSDERIKDDINDRLTDYAYLDASDIDVEVNGGEVILSGTVESRYAKRMAEDIVDNISGVTHVENRIRVKQQNQQNQGSSQTNFASTNTSGSTGTYGSRDDLRENYTNQGLTGSQTGTTGSSLTDTTSSTAGTNAGTSSGTTGATTGSNPGTMTAAAGTGTSGTTGSSTTGTADTTSGSTGTGSTSGTTTGSTSGGRGRNKNE